MAARALSSVHREYVCGWRIDALSGLDWWAPRLESGRERVLFPFFDVHPLQALPSTGIARLGKETTCVRLSYTEPVRSSLMEERDA